MRRTLSLVLLAALALAGCSRAENQQHQIYVFGTLIDINLWQVEPEAGRRAVARLDEDFQVMHREWHAWEPGPLVEANRAIAAGRPVELIPSLVPVVRQSKALARRSEQLFNPAIGGLLALWGFQSSERPHGPPPSVEAIRAWVAQAPTMEAVTVEGNTLTSSNSAVQLDFGAFAKGYAIDLAIARLREFGIENAIVNAGGDLRAIGSKGGEPWRVGVRHPQGSGILAAIEVGGDESVFTSGNYERYREHEGVRYQHILDPRTGMPVDGVTSVTVIHDNGAEADAAATALVVAGPDGWHRIARRLGIKHVMLVDDVGTVYLNPAMRERVRFETPPEQLVISPPL